MEKSAIRVALLLTVALLLPALLHARSQFTGQVAKIAFAFSRLKKSICALNVFAPITGQA
jgi:hypothetical protein